MPTTPKTTEALESAATQSVAGLFELNKLASRNVEGLMSSLTAGARGAEVIRTQVADYSAKVLQDQVSQVQALAAARTLQDVVQLQTSFLQQSIGQFTSAFALLSTTCTTLAQESAAPFTQQMTAMTPSWVKAA